MNALRYAHILARLIDAPLWAHPVKAAIVYNLIGGRLGYPPLTIPDDPAAQTIAAMRRRRPEASRFVGEWPISEEEGSRRVEPFRLTRQGVGIITVSGVLINRGAFIGSYSGETSYEGIKHQLARAAADSRVKSLILDLDTPGGEANGAFEAAQMVREAAARKPVIAIANGMAASAGYALASGATRIIAAPSAISGSIGVALLHLDFSRQLDHEGVTPTLIFEGARKMDGNPLAPLSADAEATLRGEVHRYYELFVETVTAGRGRRTPARAARDTEGRVYVGREAIDARLVDDVGTFEEVLSDLTRRTGRQGVERPAAPVGAGARAARMRPMENLELEGEGVRPLAAYAAESIRPLNAYEPPEVRQAALDHAAAEAASRATAEAIARFRAIGADPRVKGKEAFALRLACEAPQMPADAVGAMCELTPASPARLSLAERSAETGAESVSSAPGPTPDPASAGWDAAVARANARTQADTRRARA
jgi:signal peptide peptidase SppA